MPKETALTDIDLSRTVWHKSNLSSTNASAEIAATASGFAIQDSKNPERPHLVVSTADWRTFLSTTFGGKPHHPQA